jgi:response regulator RpfG family c-di-GMP phosphodiesterase
MAEQRGDLRVLHIEDSDDDARLVESALRRAGYTVHLLRVETAAELTQALNAAEWDVLLADFSLPHFSGPAALDVVRQSGRDLPVIILSGTINEEQAVTALRAGARDFILKGNLARLAPAIERERREAANRRQQRAAEARLALTLDTMMEGAQIIGFDWRYLYVNDTLTVQARRPKHELLGYTMLEAYPGIEQTPLFAALQRCMDQRAAERLENEFIYPDGSRGWFELSIQPAPEGIFILSQDISERKRAAAQIQRQLDQLAALRAIDIAISTNLDVRHTLTVLLEQVLIQLGVHAADVFLLDPATQTLHYAAGRGFQSEGFQGVRLRLGEGRAGQAALQRRLVSASGAQVPGGSASLRTGLLGRDHFAVYYGVPLIAKGQVVGVLEVFNRAPLQPDAAWLQFLEALAGQAAIAIENATLFEGLQRSSRDVLHAYDATIEGWARALDLRDRETEGHSRRVTDLTLRLAQRVGFDETRLEHVRRGALLHDMGKLAIPDHILLKPGPLSDDEWVVMRQHPEFARNLLTPIEFLRPALEIPFCHHERWDGAGYPSRLRGEQIPLAARLFAVVDVWDALRSDRPYRPAWPTDRVLDHIRAGSGAHFDPRAVEVFLQVLT